MMMAFKSPSYHPERAASENLQLSSHATREGRNNSSNPQVRGNWQRHQRPHGGVSGTQLSQLMKELSEVHLRTQDII